METKETLYLETTIPSYLAAKPSRDLITAAHQQETHDWWDKDKERFHIFISQAVLDEIRSGDPNAALLRSKFLEGADVLPADNLGYQTRPQQIVCLWRTRYSTNSTTF